MVAYAALYLLGHLTIYLGACRRLSILRGERGVFFYHAVSFAAVAAVLGGVGVSALIAGQALHDPLRDLLLILAAHGIYSLTFLEFWSLSQGGYSVSILSYYADRSNQNADALPPSLVDLGRSKLEGRIQSLQNLRLVTVSEGNVRLTSWGRVVSFLLVAIRGWVNVKEAG